MRGGDPAPRRLPRSDDIDTPHDAQCFYDGAGYTVVCLCGYHTRPGVDLGRATVLAKAHNIKANGSPGD